MNRLQVWINVLLMNPSSLGIVVIKVLERPLYKSEALSVQNVAMYFVFNIGNTSSTFSTGDQLEH